METYGDQKSKVTHGYKVSSQASWIAGESVQNRKQSKKTKQQQMCSSDLQTEWLTKGIDQKAEMSAHTYHQRLPDKGFKTAEWGKDSFKERCQEGVLDIQESEAAALPNSVHKSKLKRITDLTSYITLLVRRCYTPNKTNKQKLSWGDDSAIERTGCYSGSIPNTHLVA